MMETGGGVNALKQIIADAAGQHDLLSLAARDRDLQLDGFKISYAADGNVLDCYLVPEQVAASDSKRRIGFGEVFRDDRGDRKALVTAMLGRFIWYDLQPRQPLLLVPPIDQEVHALYGILEKFFQLSPEDEKRLNDVVQRMHNAGATLSDDETETLRKLILLASGRPRAGFRMNALVETKRFLSIDALPYAAPGEVDPELADLLRPWTSLDDMVAFATARADWLDMLIKAGRMRSDRMERDAEALARLEVWNKRLEENGIKRRIVYLTGDTSILTAASKYHIDYRGSYRDLYVRHPRCYLDDQSFQLPRPPAERGEIYQEGEYSLTRLLELLIDRFLDNPPLGEWVNGMFVLKPSLVEQLDGFCDASGGNAWLATKVELVKEYWDDLLDGIAARSIISRDFEREFDGALQRGAECLKRYLQEVRPEIDDELHQCWEKSVEATTTPRFIIEVFADKDVKPRRTPLLCLEGDERWLLDLRQAQSWFDKPETFSSERLQRMCAEARDRDLKGYNFTLLVAFMLSNFQQWSSAALLCEHALRISAAVSSGPIMPDGANGREAAFLLAFCRRHMAQSENDLEDLDRLLDKAREIACREQEAEAGHDCIQERFDAETLALRLSRLLFRWSKTEVDQRSKAIPSLTKWVSDAGKLAIVMIARRQEAVRDGSAAGRPSRMSAGDKAHLITDVYRRLLLNIIGASLLFPQDEWLREAGASAFGSLDADLEHREYEQDNGVFFSLVYALGGALYAGGNTRKRVKKARELAGGNAFEQARVFPYDEERFKAFASVLDIK